MSTTADHNQRTWAFRRVGILACGAILTEAEVLRPADQMTVVWEFLHWDAEFAGSRERPRRWAEKGLRAAARDWMDKGPRTPWSTVFDALQRPVDWRAEEEFGNLLCSQVGRTAFRGAAQRLKRSGLPVDWSTLVDLRYDFTAYHLPHAIRSFDPEKGAGKEARWLGQLFYRYALRSIHTDAARKEQLFLLAPMPDPDASPEDVLLDKERKDIAADVLRALEHLPEVHRTAVRMYFGLEDHEAGLKEIGKAIGVTRFKARSLVVMGLARLTLAAGLQDRFGSQELAFARLLFDEGLPPSEAARALGASTAELGSKMGALYVAAFRSRTVDRGPVQSFSEVKAVNQITRLTEPTHSHQSEEHHLNELLRSLEQAPDLSSGSEGTLSIRLGMASFDIEDVREFVTDETIEFMLNKGVEVDWLLSGPLSPSVADMAPELAEELEAAQASRWGVAYELLEACERRVGKEASTSDERHILARRICLALISTTQAIDRELPPEALVHGNARLLVASDGTPGASVIGRWSPVTPPPKFDVEAMIRQQAAFAGGLEGTFLEALAAEMADLLSRGELPLDGFVSEGVQNGEAVYLRVWQPMDFEEDA